MRTRWKALAAAGLLLTTTGISTAHALHRENAADKQLRDRAFAAVSLSVLPPERAVDAPGLSDDFGKVFPVAVENNGPDTVVVERASWRDGLDVMVEQTLEPTAAAVLLLPQPTACPTRRLAQGVDHVDVLVLTRGGHKKVRLNLPAPDEPTAAFDQRCGLFRARESLNGSVSPRSVRRGEVVLDVSVEINGPRATQLLSIQGGSGITATVTERLPLTLALVPAGANNQVIPHSATVTLRLQDCATVKAHAADQEEDPGTGDFLQPPTYYQVQLVVQHPGDDAERVNLELPAAAANALTATCGIPPRVDSFG